VSKSTSISSASRQGTLRKLETKKLAGTEDSDYSSEDESDDDRKGGQKLLPLLMNVSKPCHRKGETKKIAHCIGSKGKSHIEHNDLVLISIRHKVVEQRGVGREIENAS
jgi:hypothetical protein